jgi:hypothetical protein
LETPFVASINLTPWIGSLIGFGGSPLDEVSDARAVKRNLFERTLGRSSLVTDKYSKAVQYGLTSVIFLTYSYLLLDRK